MTSRAIATYIKRLINQKSIVFNIYIYVCVCARACVIIPLGLFNEYQNIIQQTISRVVLQTFPTPKNNVAKNMKI